MVMEGMEGEMEGMEGGMEETIETHLIENKYS